jgi:hypothetical protein
LGNPSPQAVGFNLLALAPGAPLPVPFALSPPQACSSGFLHLIPAFIASVSGNPAFTCLTVPPLPELAGALVTVQAASLEQGVCFRVTDAMVVRIQP